MIERKGITAAEDGPRVREDLRLSRLVVARAAFVAICLLLASGAVPYLGVATGISAAAPPAPHPRGCEIHPGSCAPRAAIDRGGRAGVSAAPGTERNWSFVQVAFLLETTPYDGVFDSSTPTVGYSFDPCLLGGSLHPCEESNAVPFFVHYAAEIAGGIEARHPGTNLSFGLVDFSGTLDGFDDLDGSMVHADVANFTPASSFGVAVNNSLGALLDSNGSLQDSDMNDSLLQSSSVTALYGTLSGGLVHWSPTAHHVVVLVGSTAPRDPMYLENYSVSAATFANDSNSTLSGGSSCEPSYLGGTWSTPNCEGWIRNQDGNASHSIAALARAGTACAASLGGTCTIDAIDLWTTSTDPNSEGWPSQWADRGGGPGGTLVITNANRVLRAGCDIANSTGGSWDGPAYYRCGTQFGSLNFTGVKASFEATDRLFGAFLNASLGEPPTVATFPVSIAETGLPAGANWTLSFNGTLDAGTASTRTISVPNGTYAYFGLGATIEGAVYSPTVPLSSIEVNGSAVDGTVPYLLSGYTVEFNETGLPSTLPWSMQVGGHGFSGAGNTSFVLPNGSYPFEVAPPTGYTALPASGVLDVTGGPAWRPVAFVKNGSMPPPPLAADFSSTVGFTCGAPFNISFTSNVTGGAPPYTYRWNFGDGSSGSALPDPTHEFNDIPASGGVTLSVTDSAGNQVNRTHPLQVEFPPCAPPRTPTAVSHPENVWLTYGAGALVVAIAAVAVVVILRRRSQS